MVKKSYNVAITEKLKKIGSFYIQNFRNLLQSAEHMEDAKWRHTFRLPQIVCVSAEFSVVLRNIL